MSNKGFLNANREETVMNPSVELEDEVLIRTYDLDR